MNTTPESRRWRSAALATTALLLAACSWAVPADPGLHARLRAVPTPQTTAPANATRATLVGADDPATERLYHAHCGRCHEPFEPQSLAAADWPRTVRRYGPRAGLFGAQRARVLHWLQANAR